MSQPNTASQPHDARTSIKETVTSIIIAFALAFVFRGFVVEAFLIPTGSMAPTLMGQHIRVTDPSNGYSWAVGPRRVDMIAGTTDPAPLQGTTNAPIMLTNPLTQEPLDPKVGVPTKAGDRIFVMKYLASVYEPSRFDVVVFKNPTDPALNYIKRLLGLPGEQLALIDGDVFFRKIPPGEPPAAVDNPWLLPGWTIARKPELAQRAMWQLLYDTNYAPLPRTGSRPFVSPWIPREKSGWDLGTGVEYTFSGGPEATLDWDAFKRPIRDRYAYDQGAGARDDRFPVSDLRVSAAIRPAADGLMASGIVRARGHEFRAVLRPLGGAYEASLEMRPDTPGQDAESGWQVLAKAASPEPLAKGRFLNFDFWHADQALELYINDELAVRAEYNWSADERLTNSLTIGAEWREQVRNVPSLLSEDPGVYKPATAALRFTGGGFSLRRVALHRDVHYQADVFSSGNNRTAHPRIGTAAAATAPRSTLTLTQDQYFACGDNSPHSLDARLWDAPDPWVAAIDPASNVVHRHLLIGKAFFVYFPAPTWSRGIPIPDFGRMRFIW